MPVSLKRGKYIKVASYPSGPPIKKRLPTPFKLILLMFKNKRNIVLKILYQDVSLREKYFSKLHSRIRYNHTLPPGVRGYGTDNFKFEVARSPYMRLMICNGPAIAWKGGNHYLYVNGRDYARDNELIAYSSSRSDTVRRVSEKIKSVVKTLNKNSHKGRPVRLLI